MKRLLGVVLVLVSACVQVTTPGDELGVDDLAAERDLAPPVDLAQLEDLAAPAVDHAQLPADLAEPQDLRRPRDFTVVRDLADPPDLRRPGANLGVTCTYDSECNSGRCWSAGRPLDSALYCCTGNNMPCDKDEDCCWDNTQTVTAYCSSRNSDGGVKTCQW